MRGVIAKNEAISEQLTSLRGTRHKRRGNPYRASDKRAISTGISLCVRNDVICHNDTLSFFCTGMVKICLIIFFLFSFTEISAQNYTKSDIHRYIETYSDVAVRKMQEHGIPASITLAQGILESAAGTSDLAVKANNHFGIKCHKSWDGKTFRKDDDSKNECFRKYKTAVESFEDHSQFLKATRYADLYKLKVTDYEGWAHGLKKAGYATNPQYAHRLIRIIEEYNLALYDKPDGPALAKNENSKNNSSKQSETKKAKNNKKAEPVQVKSNPQNTNLSVDNQAAFIPQNKPYKDFTPVDYPYTTRPVYRNNGVYFVVAQKGDTYFSIARDVQLGMGELKMYNDVPNNKYEPCEGEMVYLQKKRQYAERHHHVLCENETLRDVAQLYGCRLKTIYKLNNLSDPSLVIGEGLRIVLKKP